MTAKLEQKIGRRKHPGGRPTKFKEEFIEQAGELCREKGYTDKDLAKHFNVTEATINNWKRGYLEFFESLKKGKDKFDSGVVEQALLKRALGYSYTETTREPVILSKKGVIDRDAIGEGESVEEAVGRFLVIVKQVIKEVAPDVTAQIFWLKNRRPGRWSDKKAIDHRVKEVSEPLTEEELFEHLKAIHGAGDGIDWRSIEGEDSEMRKRGYV